MNTIQPRNRLLTLLPPDIFDRVTTQLTPFIMHQHDVLLEERQTATSVWFLDSGVASWLAPDGEGNLIEVATIGNEGMVGTSLFLDRGTTFGHVVCQVSGSGWQLPADAFREEIAQFGPFHNVIGRYVHAVMTQMAQTAVCNRVHSINERCARWLLLTHDRVDGDQFSMTHEYLAAMLGVRRATVTVAAGILAHSGLIRYHRGDVEILDRTGLEEASCPCYRLVRNMFEQMLGAETG